MPGPARPAEERVCACFFAALLLLSVQDLAWELGRPSHRHGWMLDRLPCESSSAATPPSVLSLEKSCLGLGGEEGTTVMPTLQMFKSQSCVYSAFDTPGREDLVLVCECSETL